MKKFVISVFLMLAATSWGQNDLPLTYKGNCVGTQTDIHDLSAIQDTPAIKCDALTVAQIDGHIIAAFSNGDPKNPVLMFSGDLVAIQPNQLFDPYLGPATSAFAISHVLWGDGTPAVSVHAGEHSSTFEGRGCYFHFNGQGWNQLSMLECELIADTPSHRPRRVTVTFKSERKFAVDGENIWVVYGANGAHSFHTIFNGKEIDGTCGARLYQINGALKPVEAGSPIDHLFNAVCYKDASTTPR